MDFKPGPYIFGLGKSVFLSAAARLDPLNPGESIELVLSERLSRKKGDGAWPSLALRALKSRQAGDLLAESRCVMEAHDYEERLNQAGPFYESLKAQGLEPFTKAFNPEIESLEHHLCHAYAALALSPFEKSLIIVMDGAGSYDPEKGHEACTVFTQDGKLLKKVYEERQHFKRSVKIPSQVFSSGLGTLYEKASEYIFNSKSSAGKVMGLAALGKPGPLEDRIAFLESLDWEKAFKGKTKKEWEESGRFELFADIAATVQRHFEESLSALAQRLKKEFPSYENLILAGGCALNCTTNGKLLKSQLFKNIYVPPFPGDEGIAFGAAFWLYYEKLGKPWEALGHEKQQGYFGPLSSLPTDEKVKEVFSDYECLHPDSLEDFVAKELYEGKIVAWFQGRSESGPRALGHRSLLARVDRPALKDHLNACVKFREAFRPYACSLPQSVVSKYFEVSEDFENPFMSFAVSVRPEYKELFKEVTHIDGSSRLQTVRAGQCEKYLRLLEAYGKLSNLPCLLNTSLNVMGEPILETVEDAHRFLENAEVDGLAIGNFYIRKKKKKTSTVVLTSKENFVWGSMQEIIPALEKTWALTASEDHEVSFFDVAEEKLRAKLPTLLKADNIYVTCFNVKIAKTLYALRKELGLKARFFIQVHNMATIACWPFEHWKLGEIFLRHDVFIVTCSHDVEALRLSYPDAQILLLPFCAPELPKLPIKRRGKLSFVYVGRISNQKNIETLLRTLALMKERDFEFQLFGGEDHLGSPNMGLKGEGYLESLKKLTQELGLEKQVFFRGHKERAELFLELTDPEMIFLSASLHADENFGMALFRALLSGQRVVCSDWGGHSDFKKHFPEQVELVSVSEGSSGPKLEPYEFLLALEATLKKSPAQKNIPPSYLQENQAKELSRRLVFFQRDERPLVSSPLVKEILARREGMKIFSSYSDPLALHFFKAYGMKTKPRLRIVSDSMSPLIKVGDEIFIERVPYEYLRRFDLLLFKTEERLFCHFLWKRGEKICITKSLKDPKHDDLPLEAKDIVGRVTNFSLSFWQRLKIYFLLFFLLSFSLFAQGQIDVEAYFDVKTGKIEKWKGIGYDASGTITKIISLSDAQKQNLKYKGLIFLPGLIDVHTHLFLNHPHEEEGFSGNLEWQVRAGEERRRTWAKEHALDLLKYGFTSVRDLGNAGREGEEKFLQSSFIGPRLFISGQGVGARGGQFAPYTLPELIDEEYKVISSPQEARALVAQRAKAKNPWIKIYADNDPNPERLGLDILKVLVAEARKYKMKVAIHAVTKEGVKNALLVKPDSLEHGPELSVEELLELKKKNIVLVPTDDQGELRRIFSQYALTSGEDASRKGEFLRKRLRRAFELQVPLAFGSDNSRDLRLYGLSFGEVSLECLLGLDLPPLEVLRLATWYAGRLLSSDLGLIAPGYKADLIAIPGDPLVNIHFLRDVRVVIKGGKIFNPNP